MLVIKAIMGSAVEDIFAFKCCGAQVWDQNLEIQITNTGNKNVTVPSHCDLIEGSGPFRINNLMPHGNRVIAPGETIAFYCMMDENRWKKAREIVFYDSNLTRYSAAV